MSKYTPTKIMRLLDYDKDAPVFVRQTVITPAVLRPDGRVKRQARGNWVWKELSGAMVKRKVAEPATPRKNVGQCNECDLPVYVSPSQLINVTQYASGRKLISHKACRKARGY